MIECIFESQCILGESIIWSDREQSLYFVDILGKKIHRYNPDKKIHKEWVLPGIVSSVVLRKDCDLLITLRKKIAFFDPKTETLDLIREAEKNMPENRFNNSACDPFGSCWIGTINDVHVEKATGNLYQLDPTGKLSVKETGGLCF